MFSHIHGPWLWAAGNVESGVGLGLPFHPSSPMLFCRFWGFGDAPRAPQPGRSLNNLVLHPLEFRHHVPIRFLARRSHRISAPHTAGFHATSPSIPHQILIGFWKTNLMGFTGLVLKLVNLLDSVNCTFLVSVLFTLHSLLAHVHATCSWLRHNPLWTVPASVASARGIMSSQKPGGRCGSDAHSTQKQQLIF